MGIQLEVNIHITLVIARARPVSVSPSSAATGLFSLYSLPRMSYPHEVFYSAGPSGCALNAQLMIVQPS